MDKAAKREERETFERWIRSIPTADHSLTRNGLDYSKFSWAGQYVEAKTRLAWAAWQERGWLESTKDAEMRCEYWPSLERCPVHMDVKICEAEERAAFELWVQCCRGDYSPLRRNGSTYKGKLVRRAWAAWQARGTRTIARGVGDA